MSTFTSCLTCGARYETIPHDDPAQHKCDRYLDCLLAKNLFGYRLVDAVRINDRMITGGPFWWAPWMGDPMNPSAGAHADTLAPFYSETWDGAAKVVEAMRQRHGFAGHNGFLLTKEQDKGWYCEFPAPAWGDGEDSFAPGAIVIAAARALGLQQ